MLSVKLDVVTMWGTKWFFSADSSYAQLQTMQNPVLVIQTLYHRFAYTDKNLVIGRPGSLKRASLKSKPLRDLTGKTMVYDAYLHHEAYMKLLGRKALRLVYPAETYRQHRNPALILKCIQVRHQAWLDDYLPRHDGLAAHRGRHLQEGSCTLRRCLSQTSYDLTAPCRLLSLHNALVVFSVFLSAVWCPAAFR